MRRPLSEFYPQAVVGPRTMIVHSPVASSSKSVEARRQGPNRVVEGDRDVPWDVVGLHTMTVQILLPPLYNNKTNKEKETKIRQWIFQQPTP